MLWTKYGHFKGIPMKTLLTACCLLLVLTTSAHAVRIKDLASFEGVRDNQLVGYGLVVGLRGTGDSSQTVFPAQTLISTLERMPSWILPR